MSFHAGTTPSVEGSRSEGPVGPDVSVFELLRRLDVVRAADVVAEGLVVRDVSRRNRVYLVDGPIRAAVKVPGSDGSADALARERQALAWLALEADGLATRTLAWDPTQWALVTELVDGEALSDRVRRLGYLETSIASEIGALLGTLHVHVARPPFASEPPAVLRLHRPDPATLAYRTGGQIALVRMLQRSESACASLDAVAGGWCATAAAHGDVKWEHVFVADGTVRLVDWECFGVGDPCWDIGCAVASVLHDGLVVTSMAAGSASEMIARADVALIQARPTIAAMWRAWEHRTGFAAEVVTPMRERVMWLAGARLLEIASGIAAAFTDLGLPAALIAQVGINFLERQVEAAGLLLPAGDPAPRSAPC